MRDVCECVCVYVSVCVCVCGLHRKAPSILPAVVVVRDSFAVLFRHLEFV